MELYLLVCLLAMQLFHIDSLLLVDILLNFFSHEMPRLSFSVELDTAHATWLANDVAMLSTKTGELLLLTLVYDGRLVV